MPNLYFLKFLYICICFLIALVSYFFCRSRRDWVFLTAGMAFTVGADFFLILHNRHVPGVAIFCFTHVFYALRAWDGRKLKILERYPKPFRFRGVYAPTLSGCHRHATPRKEGHKNFFTSPLWGIVTGAGLISIIILFVLWGNVLALAAVYAALFIISLALNFCYRRSLHNPWIVLTGLIFFALCDIAVALMNVPRYLGIFPSLVRVYPFIWLFYLPSQTLLAISAVRFKRK